MTDLVLKLLDRFSHDRPLPDPLPADPLPIFKAWFDEAITAKQQPNPNCFYLGTAADNRPSVRTVLCKAIDLAGGSIEFYTNYHSRKAGEVEGTGRVAALFHWDHADRQVRIEGPVCRTTDAESDAYFRSRRWESRLGAWASDQSQPVASRKELLAKVGQAVDKLGLDVAKLLMGGNVEIPRPPHWGGYRVWIERIELWQGGVGRVHDRAAFTRTVGPASVGTAPARGTWAGQRLQP